mmetsp:Transcript_74194/g.131287  ORF Transcript_74194/g.131287 Transcript_74194/m.131287 type:complete len:111 (-) Transcript_74194:40-372(-)
MAPLRLMHLRPLRQNGKPAKAQAKISSSLLRSRKVQKLQHGSSTTFTSMLMKPGANLHVQDCRQWHGPRKSQESSGQVTSDAVLATSRPAKPLRMCGDIWVQEGSDEHLH